MKTVEPKKYLNKIRNALKIEPILGLDFESIAKINNEFEKRIRIAESFIPEIEYFGHYDMKYDIATTIVMSMLYPPVKHKVINHLTQHYDIEPIPPSWNLKSYNDTYWFGTLGYHPYLPTSLFCHYQRQANRREDLGEFIRALQIYRAKRIPMGLSFFLFLYYGLKVGKLRISQKEVELIHKTLPFYPKKIEEINLFLENKYCGDAKKEITFLGSLMQKMQRDYKTVKKILEELKVQKLFRSVRWHDKNLFGLESIDIHYTDLTKYIRHPYSQVNRKLIGEEILTTNSLHIPMEMTDQVHAFLKQRLRTPFTIYKMFTLPYINFNFQFLAGQGDKWLIDWDIVAKHMKKCEIDENTEDFAPVRAPTIETDRLLLEVATYLMAQAAISDTFLANELNRNIKTIQNRRKIYEKYSMTMPYIYNFGCPELYLLYVKAKTIGEINYVLRFFSIFPFVFYAWAENIKEKNDNYLNVFLNLPKGSFEILRCVNEYLKLNFKLYIPKMRIYGLYMSPLDMYDDEKKKFTIDFNKFEVINV
ncbi:MAG: hypothetical protein ACTSRG_13370 [Candidatus Helarchaeota archaeon]